MLRLKIQRFAPASLLFIILAVLAVVSAGCQASPPQNATSIDLSQAVALSNSNNISEARLEQENGWMLMVAKVDGDTLRIEDSNGNQVTISNGALLVTDTGSMDTASLQEMGFNFPEKYSVSRGNAGSTGAFSGLIAFMPLLFFGLLLFLLMRMGGNAARGQLNEIGRSKARLNTGTLPSVTFADVAGVPEAKQDLLEVVDFLKNQRKFQRLGARVPKGIMLVGPPGTGKTLLAKAVAGEAGVPFFSLSGSEFVEVYVGVGASRVRDLFQKAKTSRPSIIFIDEIDAVGRKRSIGPGASHEEREQTLNQILSEMDGFTPNSGVIVLAATNRVDVLDPALMRPGRFDRQVVLDNPDSAGRKAILQIHIRGKPLAPNVNLEVVAKQTAGFSGADLANMVNEAAILAARRDKDTITPDEFNEAIDRVIAGPARKSRKVNPLDKKRTAYHEGGHALVARMLPDADPLFKISIVARGGIGGYTRTLPEEEHYLMTKEQLLANLAMLLAGHTAEKMIFGNVSTGPHNDIKQATELARKMITEYGMSDKLSLRTYGGEDNMGYWGPGPRNYGEDVAKAIDNEVHSLIDGAHDTAREILIRYRSRLVYLAEKLIEMETLEGPELEQVFTEPIPDDNGHKEASPNKADKSGLNLKAPAAGV